MQHAHGFTAPSPRWPLDDNEIRRNRGREEKKKKKAACFGLPNNGSTQDTTGKKARHLDVPMFPGKSKRRAGRSAALQGPLGRSLFPPGLTRSPPAHIHTQKTEKEGNKKRKERAFQQQRRQLPVDFEKAVLERRRDTDNAAPISPLERRRDPARNLPPFLSNATKVQIAENKMHSSASIGEHNIA